MTLQDPVIDKILEANPSVTVTSNGNAIPYPFPSPQDWRDHWIYFLLVDRFDNPLRAPDPNEFPCDFYQGGNFSGIKQRLPYLKKLGVGAIWLSPVLINPQWFKRYWGGYGIFDFLRIEPRFCDDPAQALQDSSIGDSEFRSLVDEAHAHGIYVILDIVLNHSGDLFNYEGMQDQAPWNNQREYDIFWRNEQGIAQGAWKDIQSIPGLSENAGIWPEDFQRNDFLRRRGDVNGSPDQTKGDFSVLKELVTEYLIPGTNIYPLRSHLIRAYQYLIAKFDLDGFRIDTMQYIEADFARVFGNAIREYALSIGKKNFFTFGEVWQDDDEGKIAEFVGRNTEKDDELIGVDAAIDFPLRKRLFGICKGFSAPAELATHFDLRRITLRKIVSSHGDAGRNYVTFIDNHDLDERFHNAAFPGQTKLALGCLMTLIGIPCVYYGTEQGLEGRGNKREYARAALWGIANAFSVNHEFYQYIVELSNLRVEQPALRYGRQYFRPTSNDGIHFDYSSSPGGVIAFSRILNDKELLIVGNASSTQPAVVHTIVDKNLNPVGKNWKILFPNNRQGIAPGLTQPQNIFHTVEVNLAPSEILVLG